MSPMAPQGRYPWIVSPGPDGAGIRLRVLHHRSDLREGERFAVQPYAFLAVESGAAGREPNHEGKKEDERAREDQPNPGQDDVEDALDALCIEGLGGGVKTGDPVVADVEDGSPSRKGLVGGFHRGDVGPRSLALRDAPRDRPGKRLWVAHDKVGDLVLPDDGCGGLRQRLHLAFRPAWT